MRTLRLSLAGTIILALLGGLGAVVLAQGEAEPATWVSGPETQAPCEVGDVESLRLRCVLVRGPRSALRDHRGRSGDGPLRHVGDPHNTLKFFIEDRDCIRNTVEYTITPYQG